MQCGRNERRVTAMLAVNESDVLTRPCSQPRVIGRKRNARAVVEIRLKDIAIARDICREDFVIGVRTRVKVGKVGRLKEDVIFV